MSKTVSTKRARRPKKIYAKGWETRRRNELERERQAIEFALSAEIAEAATEGMKNTWQPVERPHSIDEAVEQKVQQRLEHEARVAQTRPSEVAAGDAILRTVMLHRDEQLSCFMADMRLMRHLGMPPYAPISVTRSQIEAIEDFLTESGFTEFGRTLPKIPKAA